MKRGKFRFAYQAYIESPDWQRRRRQHPSPKQCVCCGQKATELHHVQYPRVRDDDSLTRIYRAFVEQPDEQLAWLCHRCHVGVHRRARRTGESVKDATRRYRPRAGGKIDRETRSRRKRRRRPSA